MKLFQKREILQWLKKNIGHPQAKIRRWKNRRYPYESTHKYQIGEDSTKIDGTSTKGRPVTDFSVFIYFEEGGNLVLSVY
jgi:hypothetical protein